MKIYKGPYLTIAFEKENDRFIQHWTTPVNSIDALKKELLMFTYFYKRHKPTQSLWLQEKFTLNLDSEIFGWIEQYVNIPCVSYGNKKVAFVVGKDVLAHLTVIDCTEIKKSVINVSHFASETEARRWLDGSQIALEENIKTVITYEGLDEDGNSIIKITRASKDIVNTIKSFKGIIEENDFIKKNIESYSSLTKREK